MVQNAMVPCKKAAIKGQLDNVDNDSVPFQLLVRTKLDECFPVVRPLGALLQTSALPVYAE